MCNWHLNILNILLNLKLINIIVLIDYNYL